MELLEELRTLRRDLDELGDSVAAVLLYRAERCFLAWCFEEAEQLLERALSHVQESLVQPAPTRGSGLARYFATCALAVA